MAIRVLGCRAMYFASWTISGVLLASSIDKPNATCSYVFQIRATATPALIVAPAGTRKRRHGKREVQRSVASNPTAHRTQSTGRRNKKFRTMNTTWREKAIE